MANILNPSYATFNMHVFDLFEEKWKYMDKIFENTLMMDKDKMGMQYDGQNFSLHDKQLNRHAYKLTIIDDTYNDENSYYDPDTFVSDYPVEMFKVNKPACTVDQT